jgi:hypothetical protein
MSWRCVWALGLFATLSVSGVSVAQTEPVAEGAPVGEAQPSPLLPPQVVADVIWMAHGLRLTLPGAEIRQNTPERLLAQRQGLVLSGAYWREQGLALRDMARSALDGLNLEEGSAEIAVSEEITMLERPAYLISGSGRQGSRTLDFALLVFQGGEGENFSLSVLHDDPEQLGNANNEQALLQGLQRVITTP